MARGPRDKPFLDPARLREAAQAMAERATTTGILAAVVGGFAMQHYGSDRLTGDVDFAADGELDGATPVGRLSFGGARYVADNGVPIDWIVRADEYRDLYAEALEAAVTLEDTTKIVAPEYLVAMKLATRRSRDHEDLVFLLQRPGLVDREKTRDLVYRLVGGRFARDEFDLVADEADWRQQRGERE